MSNIIKLHFVERPETRTATVGDGAEVRKLPYSVTRRAYARRPRCSDNGTPEERAARKRSSPANMHKVVYRSTNLILASSEVELVRDIRLDVERAETKLQRIRDQIKRDQEHAAARAIKMSLVESRLAAALAAAIAGPSPG